MGYTHYFELLKKPEDAKVKLFNEFVAKAIELSTVPICNGYGNEGTEAEINDEVVIFNGCGDDSYETFVIDYENIEWGFCKTAMKPYDEVVVACLYGASQIFGEDGFKWSSDGNGEEGDFDEGKALYEKTLNTLRVKRRKKIVSLIS